MKLKHLILGTVGAWFIYVIGKTIFFFDEINLIFGENSKDDFYTYLLVLTWVVIVIVILVIIVEYVIKNWNKTIL